MIRDRLLAQFVFIAGAVCVFIRPAPALAFPSGPPQDRHDKPTIRWTRADDASPRIAVELVGLEPAVLSALAAGELSRPDWSSVLTVRIASPGTPPLWGTYTASASGIRFVPRFPLEPGMRYTAEFRPARLRALLKTATPKGDEPVRSEHTVAMGSTLPTASVAAIFPTRDLLPENVLKFYIQFTEPMSRGEAYARIRLLDERGVRVADPFLELGEELWSRDGTRFTLLIDPGRIKRGLRPREEVGPVFEKGRKYMLEIDAGWLDARGNPLRGARQKAFRVGPEDDRPPMPATWSIFPPQSGTVAPLVVSFPESLDHVLLLDRLIIRDARGAVVSGSIAIGREETEWRFTPTAKWVAGDYVIDVATDLEDLAGNSIARPFEVDVVRPISERTHSERMRLPFRIGDGR